jgi:hypothetical protein
MKLNMKKKMIIGATLCALALSANADGSCAIAKRASLKADGIGSDAYVWVGFACRPVSSIVAENTDNTLVWQILKPGQEVKTSQTDCSGKSYVYTADNKPTKVAPLNTWSDRAVFGVSNIEGVCVGVVGPQILPKSKSKQAPKKKQTPKKK